MAKKRDTFGDAPLGSGGRFAKCVREMSKRPNVYDPEGLCASIGRKAYGKRRFQAMARKGRARRNPWEGSPEELRRVARWMMDHADRMDAEQYKKETEELDAAYGAALEDQAPWFTDREEWHRDLVVLMDAQGNTIWAVPFSEAYDNAEDLAWSAAIEQAFVSAYLDAPLWFWADDGYLIGAGDSIPDTAHRYGDRDRAAELRSLLLEKHGVPRQLRGGGQAFTPLDDYGHSPARFNWPVRTQGNPAGSYLAKGARKARELARRGYQAVGRGAGAAAEYAGATFEEACAEYMRQNPVKADGRWHRVKAPEDSALERVYGPLPSQYHMTTAKGDASIISYQPRKSGASASVAAAYEVELGQKVPAGTKWITTVSHGPWRARRHKYSAHDKLDDAKQAGESGLRALPMPSPRSNPAQLVNAGMLAGSDPIPSGLDSPRVQGGILAGSRPIPSGFNLPRQNVGLVDPPLTARTKPGQPI